LDKVHSALAYDRDHEEAMDGPIENRHEHVTELRAGVAVSPGRRKPRERGLIP
jgi:hypothetical protein